ncbi:MAG: GntR family transcriptional regulator [Oscillospiraceae bacterium]|jgi:GntR family transcriptional regulator, rspAB operon transcriptional repressor
MDDTAILNGLHPYTSDEVFEQILKNIIEFKLKPGQRISENEMSAKFNVSRSIIRTAFARLQQLKFIEVYPQRGTYISLIDLNDIADLLLLRTAVEKEVIFEMFRYLKKETRINLINKLEENMAQQEKCRNEQNYYGKFPSLDSSFHMIMINSVGRKSLVERLSDAMLHIARWRNFDVEFGNRIPQLINEHRAIVDALKRDDMLLAQDKLAEHLETISEISDAAKKIYPEYFK